MPSIDWFSTTCPTDVDSVSSSGACAVTVTWSADGADFHIQVDASLLVDLKLDRRDHDLLKPEADAVIR